MLKKLCSLVLTALLMVYTSVPAFADTPSTAEDKLVAVEKLVYGSAQTGSLSERIEKLENEYSGANTKASMLNRVNYLYNFTFDNASSPSLVTQMNALEWAISNKISKESIQNRVTEMEVEMSGHPSTGTLHERMNALSQFAFGTETIPLAQVSVPANTLVKIALVTPINAKNLKAGDQIQYRAAEDVIEDGMLLFAEGALGEGEITKVKHAANFGRNAAVEADFKTMMAVDGSVVDMVLGKESKDKMESLAMAAGASLAGMLVLGPVGIIAGAFVKGKNVDLPEGTELYIQTANDTIVYAIPTAKE